MTKTAITLNERYRLDKTDVVYWKSETLEGKEYYVFISGTPAPDWFRYHYVPKEGMTVENQQIDSNRKGYFTRTDYRPDIVDFLINQKMREQFSRLGVRGGKNKKR